MDALTQSLDDNLARIEDSGAAASLRDIRRGIEKESLRVDDDGLLSQKPHPECLGSALTHPYITTDYAESLLEFVTPVSTELKETIAFLETIHAHVYRCIGAERLWVNSMPCIVPDEARIPIAQYGSSNIGTMKNVYRRGLGHRYGRLMQCIAGIHYNFSLPDIFWDHWLPWGTRKEQRGELISAQYFAAVRNFHRYCWLLFYLFGASPAVCRSFVGGRRHPLEPFDAVTLHAPHATSLRMSNLGYHNPAQGEVNVTHDNLRDYVASLRRATTTPFPTYEKIGVKVDGEYRQLNANLLQIENEYYAVIRPKRVAHSGETPSHALAGRGVEYIEVRCLDLNPFLAVGIDADTARFLDLFLLMCLFADSPRIEAVEARAIAENKTRVAFRGREPGLRLAEDGTEVELGALAQGILAALAPFATLLDRVNDTGAYAAALGRARECIEQPETTPSARILTEMTGRDESFVEFAQRKADEHHRHFNELGLSADALQGLEELALDSLARQREIEAADDTDFDTFLTRYFAQP